MTFRTVLLVLCMVAVPATALFSHRIPAGFRAAVRDAACSGLARCRAAVAARFAPAEADGDSAKPAVVAPPSQGEPQVVGPPSADAPPAATATVTAVAKRLAGYGATDFACRPLAGPGGTHVAVCHVPLDAGGQLMRVFQVTGGDHDAAAVALLAEVETWRLRAVPSERRESAAAPRAYR